MTDPVLEGGLALLHRAVKSIHPDFLSLLASISFSSGEGQFLLLLALLAALFESQIAYPVRRRNGSKMASPCLITANPEACNIAAQVNCSIFNFFFLRKKSAAVAASLLLSGPRRRPTQPPRRSPARHWPVPAAS